MKETQVYVEKYRKGNGKLRDDKLPSCVHTNGVQPVEAHLLAAGVVERDGVRLEFQDMRLYFPKD